MIVIFSIVITKKERRKTKMDENEFKSLKKTIKKEGFDIIGRKELSGETILYLKTKDKKEED